jgi:hypothetical protein
MPSKKTSTPHSQLLRTCSWCTERIAPGAEIFGFGAKVGPTIDLTGKEGQFVALTLALAHKTVVALVPAPDSQARADGYDLIFITCSEDCAMELKEALELERDVFRD